MTFNVSTLEIAGGGRCWGIGCELKLDTMHILEVKYGPPGAICSRSRPDFSRPRAPQRVHDCIERATKPVGHGSLWHTSVVVKQKVERASHLNHVIIIFGDACRAGATGNSSI